ncbi:L-lactate permease [Ancylobacter dichloromethanicus]
MPLFLIMVMTRFFGRNKSWTEGLSAAPFAILGAFAMTVPYVLAATFLGAEFPSLLGGLIGLAVMTLAARFRFLVPKHAWDFAPPSEWPKEWFGKLDITLDSLAKRTIPLALAWTPYVLLAVLLVVTRMVPSIGGALKSATLAFSGILGERGINGDFPLLFSPGGLLVIICLITVVLHRMSFAGFGAAVRESSGTLIGAGFVLIFTVPMVRVMINSGVNANGLDSMPVLVAEWVSTQVGAVYPVFAPAIGALGAFLAGSNTVSNLMLSQFQFSVAQGLGISSVLMVAGQSVGAAAGNMIAIHNVVAASATVGLLGREGATLRITILPTIYYLIVAGTLLLIGFYVIGLSDPLMGR